MINLRSIKFKKIDVPFVVWMVVISTFVASAGTFSIFGRQIAGWAWVIPLIISIIIVLRKGSSITLPIRIWYPWICVVVLYFVTSGFSYPQRNIMLLCPIIVGMAASKSRVTEFELKGFLRLTQMLLLAVFMTVVMKTGLLFTGILPGATGFAPQSITAALLCSIFAVEYSINRQKSLFQWIIGATIPVIALTRMAIMAAGITIPFTFASLGAKKRIIFLIIIGVLSISIFYTERIQKKMFYSGAGTLQDVRLSNPDFFTAGRSRLWDLMIEEIKLKPVWGHGANASEDFVLLVTWGALKHPHNDWLRLLYDYGLVGVSIFVICIVIQVVHLLKRAKRTSGESRILLYAGASSFLPFVLLMFADNIILYAAFFGNLQFTILGLAYAAHKASMLEASRLRYSMFFNRVARRNNRKDAEKTECISKIADELPNQSRS